MYFSTLKNQNLMIFFKINETSISKAPKIKAKSKGPDISASLTIFSSHFLNIKTERVLFLIFSRSIPKSIFLKKLSKNSNFTF